MRFLPRLRKGIARRDGDPRDAIARLLQAAREDEAFRREVLLLLRAPPLQRTSLVNTALHEMELRGEPADARAAFAFLATDQGAKIALEILTSR